MGLVASERSEARREPERDKFCVGCVRLVGESTGVREDAGDERTLIGVTLAGLLGLAGLPSREERDEVTRPVLDVRW